MGYVPTECPWGCKCAYRLIVVHEELAKISAQQQRRQNRSRKLEEAWDALMKEERQLWLCRLEHGHPEAIERAERFMERRQANG